MPISGDGCDSLCKAELPPECLGYTELAEADRAGRWFEVWLIPETLRMTTFGAKHEGDSLNLEIERATQVVVDTVRDALDERLGALLPALERLLAREGLSLDELAGPAVAAPRLPRLPPR